MRIYIKHEADTDYRFDFGFSDDLEKLESRKTLSELS